VGRRDRVCGLCQFDGAIYPALHAARWIDQGPAPRIEEEYHRGHEERTAGEPEMRGNRKRSTLSYDSHFPSVSLCVLAPSLVVQILFFILPAAAFFERSRPARSFSLLPHLIHPIHRCHGITDDTVNNCDQFVDRRERPRGSVWLTIAAANSAVDCT